MMNKKGKDHPLYKRQKTKCDTCGKKLELYPCKMKKHAHHFCNKKCYNRWLSKNWKKIHAEFTHDFKLEPTPELSYIIGVHYGDGSIYHYKRNYAATLHSIDREFTKEWGRCSYIVIGKEASPTINIQKTHYKPQFYSSIYSKKLYFFLSKSLDEHKDFIEKYPADFIRGFFDSEGCVRKETHRGLKVSANNTDKQLLLYIKQLLGRLGIRCTGDTLYCSNARGIHFLQDHLIISKKPIYEIRISNHRAIRLFNNKISMTIVRKKGKIDKFLQKYEKKCKLCEFSFIANVQYQKYCPICSEIIGKGLYPNQHRQLIKLKKYFKNKTPITPLKKSNNQYKLISRITLDLDDPSQLEYSLQVIRQFGFTKDVDVKTSSGGHGKHVIGWTEEGGYPLYQLLFIRRLAKEDPTRISLDSWGSGQRMINVLFTGKKRKKLKEGDVVFDEQDMHVETCGTEDNVRVSFGET